ncbi:MAG: GNAT family N-acetyltransferase [Promethearchaeota archaeon]
MEFEKGYSSKVDDCFSIHIAKESEEELKAIVNLNKEIHQNPILDTFIHQTFLEHPRKEEILCLYIKDDKKNKIVSSICLVPLEWQIEDIKLQVCEMEFVGTLEQYRNKGLIKILNKLYEDIMDQKGYILSVIKGIPYFYRNLRYEYASSLDDRISIPVSKIPNKKFKNLDIRKANFNDIPFIKLKYSEYHKNFYIFNTFDQECFKFKYLQERYDSEVRSTYIFEEGGIHTNYFSFGMSYDNQNYEIISPDLSKKEMIALLQFIKTEGNYNEKDTIILSINELSKLFSYIKYLGGKPVSTYGWQVKIPNLKKFFYLIKILIQNRLKYSEFNGLTKAIRISDYHRTIILNFNNGKIENIDIENESPNPKITDLMIPDAFLYKLVLGDKTIDEINYIIKDAIVNISSKSLIETIFPKKRSLFGSYL